MQALEALPQRVLSLMQTHFSKAFKPVTLPFILAKENMLDEYKVIDLLNGESPDLLTEERLHPWRHSPSHSFRFPLLRVWDRFSGSQPDEHNRIYSRALNKRLDTLESRRSSLTTHIDHRNWTPTPFISFTSSPAAVAELAEWRLRRRGV